MKEQIFEEYQRIAPMMESLKQVSDAHIRYHLLAGAIYWSDEIPASLGDFAENCLRLILRYRTTLILGTPESKWEPYWHEAVRQFPRWIGFDPSRTSVNAELRQLILRLKSEAESASDVLVELKEWMDSEQ